MSKISELIFSLSPPRGERWGEGPAVRTRTMVSFVKERTSFPSPPPSPWDGEREAVAWWLYVFLLIVPMFFTGCVLAPKETASEQARAKDAGKAFEKPFEKRDLPEIPVNASWQDVLHRAFLASGDLESAYFEWAAALDRIPQAAGYPNTNVAPSFSYMFSSQRMKSFDRTTVNVGFDPMRNLELPPKVAQRGKIALDEAQAAGKRFEATKFELQRRVLSAYLELAMLDEKIRIAHENVDLLKALTDAADNRVRVGGNQQDLLRFQTQYRLSESVSADLESQRKTTAAMLNAMLARDPATPLTLPNSLPQPRALPGDDAQLIALGVDTNPDLQRLAHEVQGRRDALELARLAYLPDINPAFMFTGSMTQAVGAMVVLPTTIPQIQGMIHESRAMLRASEATLRQTKYDRAASFVAALYGLRNSERQVTVLDQTIRPRAEQVLTSARQSYTTGTGTFIDLIDAQRTLLDVRQMIAEARIDRERRLAELEALAGVDAETLPAGATTEPTTHPTTTSAPISWHGFSTRAKCADSLLDIRISRNTAPFARVTNPCHEGRT
jgi:cobalt-zinc-cadmium efflux system outer membrane protein